MLLIPVKLGASSVQGIGVFTTEPVLEGKLVFKYSTLIDRSYRRSELEAAPKEVLRILYHYIWKSKLDIKGTRYGMYGDEARYINHKDKSEANLYCSTLKALFDYYAVAARDIASGEELFWDYLQFDAIDTSPGNLFEVIRQRTGIQPDAYDDWIEGRSTELATGDSSV